MNVEYEDRLTEKVDRTNIDNRSLSWGEAMSMFMYDLPALAERINYETEEVENLW